jgi:hypothetical protein
MTDVKKRWGTVVNRKVYGEHADEAWLDHDGVVRETDKAKLFRIGGHDVWLPKSRILDENDELVCVPRWIAGEKGLV